MSRKEGRSLRKNFLNGLQGLSVRDLTLGKTLKKNSQLLIDSEVVGDGERQIFIHQAGYPLASEKLLKPMNFKPLALQMLGSTSVAAQMRLDFEVCTKKLIDCNSVFGSGEFKSKSKSKKEKGTAWLVVDNNSVSIYKRKKSPAKISVISSGGRSTQSSSGSELVSKRISSQGAEDVEPDLKFFWAHAYALQREDGSNEFHILFYNSLDYDSEDAKFCNNQVEIKILTVKAQDGQDASEMMKTIYAALESQAVMTSSTANTMLKRGNPERQEAVEDYFRLAFDLWCISAGPISASSIEALEKLISLLKNKGGHDAEVEYWERYNSEQHRKLAELDSQNEVVAGIEL